MVKHNGKNWQLMVTRNMSLFHASFDVMSQARDKKLYGTDYKNYFYLVRNGRQSSVFMEPRTIKRFFKSAERICSTAAKLERLEATYKRLGQKLLIASEKLEAGVNEKNYRDFSESYLNLAPGLMLTTALGRMFYQLLAGALKRKYPKLSSPEIDRLISIITFPSRRTPLMESQLSLLSIGASLQKRRSTWRDSQKFPEIDRFFKKHCLKFRIVPVNFNENPWTNVQMMNQLRDLMKKDCAAEKRQLLKNQRNKISQAEARLKSINNQKINLYAAVLQKGTYLNEYRKFVFCRASLAYRPLFRLIAKKFHLKNWQECWKLTHQEIKELYFGNQKEILKSLNSRLAVALVLDLRRNKINIHTGKALIPFLGEVEIKNNSAVINPTAEVRGMIANAGKVVARARIIISRDDFKKFKDGEVIVTPMTSVDFVPIMERASAFVTDEGGLTSHASIVSRELNKPCIIGTKIATKVFKDGDLVEVDADKGVVKIVK